MPSVILHNYSAIHLPYRDAEFRKAGLLINCTVSYFVGNTTTHNVKRATHDINKYLNVTDYEVVMIVIATWNGTMAFGVNQPGQVMIYQGKITQILSQKILLIPLIVKKFPLFPPRIPLKGVIPPR